MSNEGILATTIVLLAIIIAAGITLNNYLSGPRDPIAQRIDAISSSHPCFSESERKTELIRMTINSSTNTPILEK